MIDVVATLIKYGYLSIEMLPQSAKPILAACDKCGKMRTTSKNNYHSLCRSCVRKGEKHPLYGKELTKEHKVNISTANKGRTFTEEAKALMSKNHADFKGEKNGRWVGGKKISKARINAKRQRELGYTLLLPLKDGEEGHHVTDEYVIGIPKEVHNSIGGRREKHRIRVLKWLKVNDVKKYEIVLSVLEEKL